jgi:hypothetical protein
MIKVQSDTDIRIITVSKKDKDRIMGAAKDEAAKQSAKPDGGDTKAASLAALKELKKVKGASEKLKNLDTSESVNIVFVDSDTPDMFDVYVSGSDIDLEQEKPLEEDKPEEKNKNKNLSEKTKDVFSKMGSMFKRGKSDESASEEKNKLEEKEDDKGKEKKELFTTLSSEQVSPLRKGETASNIAAKIYSLVKREGKEEKKEHKKEFRESKEEEGLKKTRHKEIVNALLGKGKFKSKIKEPKLEAPKAKKPAPGKPSAPKPGKPPAPAPAPKSGKPPAQTPAPTPAPKIEPAPPKVIPSIPTAAKVAVGAAALGVTASAIGGAESAGNYEITYGDRVDKKGNVVRGKNLSPEEKFGKKLTELTLHEVDTLGKERNKLSPSTSAMGKYQFMNSILFGAKDKKGNFRPGLVQQLGLDMETKFTPEVQEKLYELLHKQQIQSLKNLGVPITPGYEYMAHYIGAGGASAVYKAKNTDMTVQEAIIHANLPDPVHGKTNEELSKIKASEFESILEKRLSKHGLSPHSSGEIVGKDSGSQISEKSTQNADMKKDLSGQQSPIIVNNNTNVNHIDNTVTTPMQRKDDSTAYTGNKK